MPDRQTVQRAREDAREGKSPNTQAGEFVREEIHHVREGKHGAASAKQAIAIGLSKARRAGVELPQPTPGTVSEQTRKQSKRDSAKGQAHANSAPSQKRSRAVTTALKKEGRSAASHEALSKQARSSAKKRGPAARHKAAVKASATRKQLLKGKGSTAKRAA